MKDETAPTAGAPGAPRAPQRPATAAPAQADRIGWLFRDSLRRQQVHPLMELLRRHRGQDAA